MAALMARDDDPQVDHAASVPPVLTDYHVHLRPDEDDTPPERYFTRENVDRYLAAAADAGIEELGVSEHIHRFTDALSICGATPSGRSAPRTTSPPTVEFVRAIAAAARDRDGLPARVARTGTATLSRRTTSTTSSGRSTSFGHDAVDHEVYDIWEATADADTVWRRYFETVAEAARSGLFDVMAHPDLVKIWGSGRPLPERDVRFYYEPFVEAVAETGVAVEVSTAGLRKPVGELYPAPALAEMLVEAGAAFSLSSDAHVPGAHRLGVRSDRGADALVGHRARSRTSREARATDGAAGMSARVGVGYDSHRFVDGRRLVLGGVEIEHDVGLGGALRRRRVTHAVIDAVLGAAGLGDLGNHFPPSDERWRDADSLDLLRTVLGRSAVTVANVDVTVVCETAGDRPAPGRDGAPAGRDARRPGERQGHDQRGDGLDRPRRGDRGDRRGHPRRGLSAAS